MIVLVRAPSRSSHSDFRWPLPPSPTKGSSTPYFRSGEYLVSDSLEPPGAFLVLKNTGGVKEKPSAENFGSRAKGLRGGIRGAYEDRPKAYPLATPPDQPAVVSTRAPGRTASILNSVERSIINSPRVRYRQGLLSGNLFPRP